MKQVSLLLALFLVACVTATSNVPSCMTTEYATVLSKIEKLLNHHTDNRTFIGPSICPSESSELQYRLGAMVFRDIPREPKLLGLVVESKVDQKGHIRRIYYGDGEFHFKELFVSPQCENEWCPTERVRIELSNENLAEFSGSGLELTLVGADWHRDLKIPASYFQAFKDSFSQPPEWTSMQRGF